MGKANQRTIELLQAIVSGDQPHKALRDWGRKYSVAVGYARTSYNERLRRAIVAELEKLERVGHGEG